MPSSRSHTRHTNTKRRNARNEEIGLAELRRHVEDIPEENGGEINNPTADTPETQQPTPSAKERM